MIEPNIERIALAPESFCQSRGWPIRGGLMVKLKDADEPVPIGSMGQGILRVLALALSLTRARNSLLLIDNIDIGLHYAKMYPMWRFVMDTAIAFNVQVVATTHSLDCVRGLAALCAQENRFLADVAIQRMGSSRAVSYSGDEIVALAKASRAKGEIEVR